MSSLDLLKKWMEKNRAEVREDYFRFLRFKSISNDPAYAKDLRACAEWLKDYISKKTALKAEVLETEGYPMVYAEDMRAGPDAPTLLMYGHYDVMPVDPIELWDSDPFEPTERDGKIYARGAVDNKGQIFYAVTALKAWKELGKLARVNLKMCIEGEEESGSPGLSKSLHKFKEKLKADSLLVIDFDLYDSKTPALTLGARGLLAMEVTLTGSKGDLHSGAHGGMAYNPNRALVELLAKVWDKEGRIQIHGFYDDVQELSDEERRLFSFHYDKESYSKEFGIDAIGGERGRTLSDNNGFRPTFEINGMTGGYTGKGVKTVIPAHASAKITCRLVPRQDPDRIFQLVSDFLKKHVEPGMKIQITNYGGEPSFRGNPTCELAKAVALASSESTGKPCKNIVSGGSIPIIAKMEKLLGVEVVGMGYELPTDNIHAPNEYFEFSRFEKGFLTVGRALELL
jgi:acetylornithine deacetylase/succinyl-diaminopimelate desuccinylase-like protein